MRTKNLLAASTLATLVATLSLASTTYNDPPRPWPGISATVLLTDREGTGLGCVTPLGILTAAHVVEDAITWHRGPSEGPTEVLSLDRKRDVALLHASGNLPQPVKLANYAPEIEEEVAYSGYVDGLQTIYHARVIGMDAEGRMLLDGMATPGTSGACVLSRDGEVFAVVLGAKVGLGEKIWVRSMAMARPVWRGR